MMLGFWLLDVLRWWSGGLSELGLVGFGEGFLGFRVDRCVFCRDLVGGFWVNVCECWWYFWGG